MQRGRDGPWARTVIVVIGTLLAALAMTACTDQGADQTGTTTSTRPLPVGESDLVPVVPVDDSVFCRTLLSLDDDDQPPTREQLTAAYVDLADEVPLEIRPAFDLVLAGLVGDEVVDPELVESATEALAEFVGARCRGTEQNPLPPPTAPG